MQKHGDIVSRHSSVTPSRPGPIRYVIQEGGYGKGGRAYYVAGSTVASLVKMKVLDVKREGVEKRIFTLTDFGKSCKL